jgi:hypothetical protein
MRWAKYREYAEVTSTNDEARTYYNLLFLDRVQTLFQKVAGVNKPLRVCLGFIHWLYMSRKGLVFHVDPKEMCWRLLVKNMQLLLILVVKLLQAFQAHDLPRVLTSYKGKIADDIQRDGYCS